MDDLTREDFERYLVAMEKSTDVLAKLQQNTPAVATTSGNMSLTVNAGGWSMMILLVVSAFVLGIAIFSSFSSATRMNNIERRQDRQDDYVNTIYQYAPQIPKPLKKEK